jgi:hypothetical protein
VHLPRFIVVVIGWVAAASACGSRSGLLIPTPEEEPGMRPGGVAYHGYLGDAGTSGGDALVPPDALPPIEAPPFVRDGMRDCPDAAATLVYVVSSDNLLMSFDPPTATFTTIGRISCPAPSDFQPFSMAVDRTGIAYVLFANDTDGEVFRVSTATASCRPTPFTSGQSGFAPKFGMAFVKDTAGPGETLYVAEGSPPKTATACVTRLASIDTKTFVLNILGSVSPSVCSPELTGTGAGNLFGFYAIGINDSAIGAIDKTTALLTNQSLLNGVAQTDSNGNGAWAFGFWGGDFYAFTAPGAGSLVTRFRPSDGSIVPVGRTAETIVGAGVSTCAPQQ